MKGTQISTASSELKKLVGSWQQRRGVGKNFTAIHHIPARQADYSTFPEGLDSRLVKMLGKRGIGALYTHQAEAIAHVLDGRHAVVVTPTASGKSLCYNLPALDALYAGDNTLYVFPTKALAQDQSAELNQLLAGAPMADPAWEAQVYDGDTPPDVRRRIRRSGKLIVTNPDMLHAAILPNHDRWRRFFESLKYVVIDELHTYRGVFGSHVANVVRRLHRICRHYGVQPTFVATSATIANPRELAETLCGVPFSCVSNNGAPASERYVGFYNPPISDPAQMRRQGPLKAAEKFADTVIRKNCGTIVFTRSRQSVEVLVKRLKDRLKRRKPNHDLHQRVASYRGGYLPELRRSIERGLRSGDVLAVISTNALELGIDIGSLDVCVLAGYPGTIASTWQQMGRAGRGKGSCLSILIASDQPLDQYIIQHPEYFLDQPPECARIDPDNLRIVAEHLKCACYELPWRNSDAYGTLSADDTNEILGFLERETNLVQRGATHWQWCAETYPATEINLRNIAEENFVVVDVSRTKPKVLAEVDFESAHKTLYPNAVYQVSGVPYRVEKLDYAERRAYVRKSNDGYYTTAKSSSSVRVLDTFGTQPVPAAAAAFGEVCVTERFLGFKKIKFETSENIGYGELDLPALDLHTLAYWVELDSKAFPDIADDPDHWALAIAGLGQVLEIAASLFLMCDPRDLGTTIGSLTDDHWLGKGFDGLTLYDAGGELHVFGEHDVPEAARHDVFDGRVKPLLSDPTIFLYDRYPGGVGFGEGLYDEHRAFIRLALDLVEGCSCERGCPSCVGPPENETSSLRASVAEVLHVLSADVH